MNEHRAEWSVVPKAVPLDTWATPRPPCTKSCLAQHAPLKCRNQFAVLDDLDEEADSLRTNSIPQALDSVRPSDNPDSEERVSEKCTRTSIAASTTKASAVEGKDDGSRVTLVDCQLQNSERSSPAQNKTTPLPTPKITIVRCVKPTTPLNLFRDNPPLNKSQIDLGDVQETQPKPEPPFVYVPPADQTFVDTVEEVIAFLEGLPNLHIMKSTIYANIHVDCEGDNLGHKGTLSLLQMTVVPKLHTWVFDITLLKGLVFDTQLRSGLSIRKILECAGIIKVFFDVRNDSDAMFTHYGIKLKGVTGLQLMEVANRKVRNQNLWGLAKCISHEAVASGEVKQDELNDWMTNKRGGKEWIGAHELGYGVFDIRPLPDRALSYAGQDTKLMPMLYRKYVADIEQYSGRMELVCKASSQRVHATQSKDYDREGGFRKMFSPRILPRPFRESSSPSSRNESGWTRG